MIAFWMLAKSVLPVTERIDRRANRRPVRDAANGEQPSVAQFV